MVTKVVFSLAMALLVGEILPALPRLGVWLVRRAEMSLRPESREFYGWAAEAEAQRQLVKDGDLSRTGFLIRCMGISVVARRRVPTSDRRSTTRMATARATYATLHPEAQQIVRRGAVACLGFALFGMAFVTAAAVHAPRGLLQAFAAGALVFSGAFLPLNKQIDRFEAAHPSARR